MKSQIGLLVAMLEDSSIACGVDHSRDVRTLRERFKHEGLSFLTITLPMLCQAFERSLEHGIWQTSLSTGFARIHRGTLPRFLSGLFLKVFEPSGQIRLDADPNAVLFIRQLTLTFKKVKHDCTKERTQKAFIQYESTDDEVSLSHTNGNLERFQFTMVCDILAPRVFGGVDHDIYYRGTIPRHGPGATSEKVNGNAKYSSKKWHTRLERSFPLDYFMSPNLGACVGLEELEHLSPESETPVRVVSVPKTQKTPRIIAVEPVCMQYTQQALMALMVPALERSKILPGHVNFTDQTVNQRLAKEGSANGKFATLDLSEASDRVSCQLVGLAFRRVRNLRRALFDTRSRKASLPNGTTRTIHKFASMGSAVCFPVESFVFFAIAITGALAAEGLSPTLRNILKVGREIYVYGDDIITPVRQTPTIISYLEALGLKVNRHKSFVTGRFRESCGYDAFDGYRVTPIYVREWFDDRLSASRLASLVSLGNQLYKAGIWKASRWVLLHVESSLRSSPRLVKGLGLAKRVLLTRRQCFGYQASFAKKTVKDAESELLFPLVAETSAALGWYSYSSGYSVHRVSEDTQAPQVRSLVLYAPRSEDPIDGYAALMKYFLRPPCEQLDSTTSVTLSARTQPVRIKAGWTSPF